VVLDASWADRRHRDWARAVAEATTADLEALRCQAPVEMAADRVTRRAEAGLDPSEATEEIARRMAGTFHNWPDAAVVDTASPIGETTGLALELLGLGGYQPPDVIS
jgi:predicted kinase